MEKLKMQTTNMVDENIKRIGELFPNCLTEVKDEKGRPQVAIDFDKLRQELSKNIVEGPEERYQFTWPDKRNAIRLANAPTTDTLRPCREESVDYPWSSWKEYVSDSCIAPFCSTKVVFSRVPKEDLTELFSSPVEEYGQILDIDTDGIRPISDSDVKAFLLKSKGIANPLIIQSLEKTRRNEMLISALSFGAGIRQLSRLTGVSFGVIQKLQK